MMLRPKSLFARFITSTVVFLGSLLTYLNILRSALAVDFLGRPDFGRQLTFFSAFQRLKILLTTPGVTLKSAVTSFSLRPLSRALAMASLIGEVKYFVEGILNLNKEQQSTKKK
jgi:hypothetical protein